VYVVVPKVAYVIVPNVKVRDLRRASTTKVG
jgi:hypothetical protein